MHRAVVPVPTESVSDSTSLGTSASRRLVVTASLAASLARADHGASVGHLFCDVAADLGRIVGAYEGVLSSCHDVRIYRSARVGAVLEVRAQVTGIGVGYQTLALTAEQRKAGAEDPLDAGSDDLGLRTGLLIATAVGRSALLGGSVR